MQTLSQTYHIAASQASVWDALVNPSTIEAWGGGQAIMSDRLEVFSLWDGEIHGKNLAVVPQEKLVQEWYGWDDALGASQVTFTLYTEGKETVLELSQTDIPDGEFEDVEAGWRNYYLEPLIEHVETNA